MKKILTVLAMMTGVITVLIWAAPIGAQSVHDLPYQAKQVVFESQLVSISPFCTEEDPCGGEAMVFTKNGKTYVEFDFVTPILYENYHLYMGRNTPTGYDVFRMGEIVVTTDDDGICHTEPIELDSSITGMPPGLSLMQLSFLVQSESYEGGPPMCGELLATGVPVSE